MKPIKPKFKNLPIATVVIVATLTAGTQAGSPSLPRTLQAAPFTPFPHSPPSPSLQAAPVHHRQYSPSNIKDAFPDEPSHLGVNYLKNFLKKDLENLEKDLSEAPAARPLPLLAPPQAPSVRTHTAAAAGAGREPPARARSDGLANMRGNDG